VPARRATSDLHPGRERSTPRGPHVRGLEEPLSLSQAEAFELVNPVGNPAFATSGDGEAVAFDLAPGLYIALCLTPTGLVDDNWLYATERG